MPQAYSLRQVDLCNNAQLRKIEEQSLGYKVARFFGLLGR